MNTSIIARVIAWIGALAMMSASSSSPTPPAASGTLLSDEITVTIVFDNEPKVPTMKTSWGYAALVDIPGADVLFDTGGSGSILSANLTSAGIDPASVGAIVISHDHADHTGGLATFLDMRSDVTLHLGPSCPLDTMAAAKGAKVVVDGAPHVVATGVSTTGELEGPPREQALVLNTDEGLLVMTGCAHPGIDTIVEAAVALHGASPLLVMGGFHLGSASAVKIEKVITHLETLGVSYVAPSHCTGKAAREAFAAAFGDHFLDVGVGATIDLSTLK